MARKTRISEEEISQAKQLRDTAKSIAEFRKPLPVILVAELGLAADRTADILGTSCRTVFLHRDGIRNQDDTPSRPWGGRRRCCMSLEEEQEFLAQWEAKASEGGVLTVPPMHAALVKPLGYDAPMSTTYRLLARHGWRKVQPDTKHPKGGPVKQAEFKKNCPKQ
jgi:hypothetical protein